MKENKGFIVKNQYKEEEKHPDYKGKINWKGEEIEIACWIAESEKGEKYFSVALSEPYQKDGANAQQPDTQNNGADDLPF